jgi:dTDP-4-dehydrorhamnose 3,5-epimerase
LVADLPFTFADRRGQILNLSERPWLDALREKIRPAFGVTYFPGLSRLGFEKVNVSISKHNVLRGIHVSDNLFKAATCLYGQIYLVAVDCREGGRTFGEWEDFYLDAATPKIVVVPPGFGLAHLVLTPQAVFHYAWSDSFDGDKQRSFRFDDKRFDINWPGNPSKFILSERDAGA